MEGISRNNGYKNFFIHIPWRIVYLILKAVETLGIKPKFTSDSVLGLVYPWIDALRTTNQIKLKFKEM